MNEELLKIGADWDTDTSKVVVVDVTQGYDVYSMTQGGLVITGNLARAMGIGQRTMGRKRRAASDFAVKADLAALGATGASAGFSTEGNGWRSTVSGDVNVLSLESAAGNRSFISHNVGSSYGQTGMTLELSIQLGSVPGDAFSVSVGDGSTKTGLLTISGNQVTWGGKVLYAADNTDHVNEYRICYLGADAANGIEAGYYVWRNGALIGEALDGSGTDSGIRLGQLTEVSCNTYLFGISLELSHAYAPLYDGRLSDNVIDPDLPPVTDWMGPYKQVNNPSGRYVGAQQEGAVKDDCMSIEITDGTMERYYGADATSPASLKKLYSLISGNVTMTNLFMCGGAFQQNGSRTWDTFLKITGNLTGNNGTPWGGIIFGGMLNSGTTMTGDTYVELSGEGIKIKGYVGNQAAGTRGLRGAVYGGPGTTI